MGSISPLDAASGTALQVLTATENDIDVVHEACRQYIAIAIERANPAGRADNAFHRLFDRSPVFGIDRIQLSMQPDGLDGAQELHDQRGKSTFLLASQ